MGGYHDHVSWCTEREVRGIMKMNMNTTHEDIYLTCDTSEIRKLSVHYTTVLSFIHIYLVT